jgi:hypothetical protein
MRIARLKSRPVGLRSAALIALLAIALLVVAQPARADVGETIILRCTHKESLRGFSQSAYRQALKELSADLEEYSECSSLIRQAQEAAAGARGGASGGASGAAPVAIVASAAEQRAITHAVRASPEPVKLKGAVIHPGVVPVDIASALNSMPTPLLVILGFLLLCLALVVGAAVRKRVRAGSSD